MNIPQYIHELLFEHNCVIVPGLGGFVASRASAVLIGPLNTIRPPHKRIAFNRNLHHNDGLLTNYIARKHSISYESALYFVERFSGDVLKALENNRPYEFANIGKLIPRIESVEFEPSQNQNYLIDSFGLSNVNAFLIKRENKMDRLNSLLNDNLDHHIIKTPGRKRSKFALAAVLVLLIIAGFTIYQYQEKIKNYSFASMWPADTNFSELLTNKSTMAEVIIPTENKDFPTIEPELFVPDSFITGTSPLQPIDLENENIPQFNRKELKETTLEIPIQAIDLKTDSTQIKADKILPIPDTNIFVIVGGSFKTILEASKVIEQMQAKGTYATIMTGRSNGPVRITLGTFTDKQEALAALKVARRNIRKDAWLLEQ